MSINIKSHFMERYVRRITELTEKNEIKQYIAQNHEVLTNNINKMFENSKFLWRGQINGPVINYYIVDNIILLKDDKDNLVTLYRVDLDFNEKIDRLIVKELLEEISKVQEDISKADEIIKEEVSKRELEAELIKSDITTLIKQLEIKKKKLSVIDEMILEARSNYNFLDLELQKYVVRLCNSIEYKKAMSELAKETK